MQTKSINFSNYSSFKIGGTFDVALLDAHAAIDNMRDYYLIGSCNNILIGKNLPPLMMLSKEFDYIKEEDNLLKIGAATPSGKIASYCKKHDIANFEFLSHLPGKLGGLVYMNAGLKEYEIFNYLVDITTLSGIKTKKEIVYGYRFTNINEPILEATFELHHGYDIAKVKMFKRCVQTNPQLHLPAAVLKIPKEIMPAGS